MKIPIGSIIIQNEYVVHRMEQNLSHNPTKLLVFILRPLKTIQQEREISFIPSIQHCLPRESNTLHYYQWQ